MTAIVSRRTAIGLLATSALLPAGIARAATGRLYLNAYGSRGGFGVAGFDAAGQIRYSLTLPGRGHGFARSRDVAVAFSRRPGDYAVVFAVRDGIELHRIAATGDRSFCGHGAFTPDGRLLFATEAVGSTGEGVLGIYDAAQAYRRIGEYPTHGLDPHEIRLMPDGRTLVVANGGILMLAGMPRLKLNIPDMNPSLVYLDSATGRLIRQVRPDHELRQLSIRHIAIDRHGRVAIAMQYEGPETDQVPLVAWHGGPEERTGLRFLPIPPEQRAGLRQYCGSAAMDDGGRLLAVTSPRGNRMVLWDMDQQHYLAAAGMSDVCGVAAQADSAGFLVSNGLGRIASWQHGLKVAALQSSTGWKWDNHMLAVTA
ncbi:DUF1513 domain-containing protein [Ferrovibrio sp.]|uniref:DUF1513 domain-containing protein n=1 Tax=Ferrovibrio sp. TaxID=1917215 RepID=UPI0026054053|nr:DUF1513 domain-containing protein [Ferrovibrio sp.]